MHSFPPIVPQPPATARTPSALLWVNEHSRPTTTDLPGRRSKISLASMKNREATPFHALSNWPTASRLSTHSSKDTEGARPPLALEIESFMRKEFYRLGKEPSQFDRIQIASESFNAIVGHFHEYETVLSVIKKEYDRGIAQALVTFQETQRLRSELKSVTDFYSYKLESEKTGLQSHIKQQQMQIQELEDSILELQKHLDSISESKKVVESEYFAQQQELEETTARCKLLSETLQNETLRQSKLVDRGKQLTSENEQLQKRCADLIKKLKNEQMFGDIGAKRVSTQDQQWAEERMQLLEKLSRWRSMFVEKQKKVEELEKKIQECLKDQPDLSSLKELCKELCPEFCFGDANDPKSIVEIFQEFAETLIRKRGEENKEIKLAAMSQTVRKWIGAENLCESDLAVRSRTHFVGLGTGPHVPVYLRYHGYLRNKRLGKGAVEKELAAFWNARRERVRAQDTLALASIDEFFLQYLTEREKSPRAAIESAYNIIDVCERGRSDPDCSMFLSILQSRVSENTLTDQIEMIQHLEEVMRERYGKMKSGSMKKEFLLPKRTVHHILRKAFPSKCVGDMLKVRFSLLEFTTQDENGVEMVDIDAIFQEDSEGNQTQFVELLRAQHLEEITEFVIDVEEALRAVLHDGKIEVGAAKTAIKVLDPAMPSETINTIVAYGAKLTTEQMEQVGELYSVSAEDFLSRIRTGVLLKRHTMKDDGDDFELVGSEDPMDFQDLDVDFSEMDAALVEEVQK